MYCLLFVCQYYSSLMRRELFSDLIMHWALVHSIASVHFFYRDQTQSCGARAGVRRKSSFKISPITRLMLLEWCTHRVATSFSVIFRQLLSRNVCNQTFKFWTKQNASERSSSPFAGNTKSTATNGLFSITLLSWWYATFTEECIPKCLTTKRGL